mmetsp:Transcript_37702/g.33721  ORF Transcript_37702/g.33721 Transcript_37702/m.33721 type:complete len:85 (+) Transcript_37702:950-1204(+)
MDNCPLIVWCLFLGYMFFPSKTAFNGQGRLFTFKLFQEILMSPFKTPEFRVIWATDQLASFVVPLKDFEYTVCFYASSTLEEEA